jgi:hypothetical protein
MISWLVLLWLDQSRHHQLDDLDQQLAQEQQALREEIANSAHMFLDARALITLVRAILDTRVSHFSGPVEDSRHTVRRSQEEHVRR